MTGEERPNSAVPQTGDHDQSAPIELQRPAAPPAERQARRAAALEENLARRRNAISPPPAAGTTRATLDVVKIAYRVLGVLVVLGIVYMYCHMQVKEQQHRFFVANQGLRDLVMSSNPKPSIEDIKRIVLGLATKAGLKLDASEIEVFVEPLSKAPHAEKLEPEELTRAQMYRARWIVGHRSRPLAHYGPLSERFELERFFYLHELALPQR